jgi:hypothetical protein
MPLGPKALGACVQYWKYVTKSLHFLNVASIMPPQYYPCWQKMIRGLKMIADALLDHSSITHRIETFGNALKSVGDMDIRSFQGDGWLDELYETDHEPNDDKDDAEEWMDDYLDDAA